MELRELAVNVIKTLETITKKQWTLISTDSENTNFQTVEREDGLTIGFNATWGGKSERVTIYSHLSDLQNFAPYEPKAIEITVSCTKSPERIANDIIRRLLPTAEARYSAAFVNKQSHDEQCGKTKRLKKKLKRYGLKEWGQQNPPELKMSGGQVGVLKTYDSKDIDLELRNLTFEQVVKILGVVKVKGKK